jgi:hypothetical protein
MADSKIEKWFGWLDGRVSGDVHTMYLHRATFQRVREIVLENGQLPESYFFEYMEDTYATSQAVAVRRQAEPNSRVSTLGSLLREMSEDAERVTRSFFVGMWDGEREPEAEEIFDERFAGSVGEHLDPAIPQRDLEALTATSDGLKTFVDEHLAHSDARPSPGLPTFKDLNAAIDQIGDLYAKYYLLLTANGFVDLVPAIQHDWLAVFRQPWIREAG